MADATGPTSATDAAAYDDDALARLRRRTVGVLASGQILGGIAFGATISLGAVLAADISGDEAFSGLATALVTLGTAALAVPLAALARRRGRRIALAGGMLIALVGVAVVILAAGVRVFPLLLAGFALIGAGQAANLQSRFAAVDLATAATRGRDLSLVVWATTIGAVAGPNLTGPGQWVARQLHLPALVGPYVLSLVGIALAALVLTAALRPDPLLTARSLQVDHDEPDPTAGLEGEATRGWAVIRTRPDALMGVVAMALGHVVMVSVMIMTPLHMRHGHAGLEIIGLVISLHVVGMYAFSPLTGWAVDRWGSRAVIAVGAGVLLTASLLAASTASGHSLRLTAALVLLGMGWSCTLIAGSTLLTAAVPLRQRPAAQGLSDVAMGLAGGGGGALAGVVVGWWGYPALGLLAGGAALLLGLLVPLGRRFGC